MSKFKMLALVAALLSAPSFAFAGEDCKCEKCHCEHCKDGKCDCKHDAKGECKDCHANCDCHKKK
jgi:hypothetical protein